MAKKGTPRRKPGSFGPHIEGFRGRLVALGYTPASVGHVLTEVSALGRWMVREGMALSDLGEQVVEAFVEDRREQGVRRVPGVRSFGPLPDYLRDEDVLAAETAASWPLPAEGVRWLALAHFRWWRLTALSRGGCGGAGV